MPILDTTNLSLDEQDLLKHTNHSLRCIGKNQIFSDFGRSLWMVVETVWVFVAAMLAFEVHSWPLAVFCLGLAVFGVACRAIPMLIMAFSFFTGKLYKRVYRKSLIYWLWWPFFDLVMVCVAFGLGATLGSNLWYWNFQPYYHVGELQTYSNIDPAITTGAQLQDAGLVEFSDTVGLASSKSGCFVNGGHTYCVSPIMKGGKLYDGIVDAGRSGVHDFFAVGIDCCSCPDQDFRCGDWRNPMAQGGIRSIDYKSRPFYQLAVEQWSAVYNKVAPNPVFFEWVQEPGYQWSLLWQKGANYSLIAVFFPVPFALIVSFVLGQLLHYIITLGWASPMDAPEPPPGFESLWKTWIPKLYHHHVNEHKAVLSVPVAQPPWYGAPQQNNEVSGYNLGPDMGWGQPVPGQSMPGSAFPAPGDPRRF